MSGNIAVIYAGDLTLLAKAFAEAASHIAFEARFVHLDERIDDPSVLPAHAYLPHLEWADGIAFGTPTGEGVPSPALMRFIDASEPLWVSGRLYDKAVTVFTEEPEAMAPDSILHPLYDALYRWGAVIVGPRDVDLGWQVAPEHAQPEVGLSLPPSRLRAAQYRAHRLARVASVLAEDRFRRAKLQM